jgi:hypothetical protein
MALDYDSVNAITHKYIVPKVADAIFDSNPLLKRAKEKFQMTVDGGERIVQPLNYAQITASGWYNGYDTLDTSANELLTGAAYTWKQAYAAMTISRREELQNSGKAAVVRLLQQKAKIAEKTLSDKLGTGLYNAGTTTNAIVGLSAIVNTSSTIGGISQSSYSWWTAGSYDSSTTTLSLYGMQTVDNACTIDNESPTVVMVTRAILNYYYALLQPQQRFTDSGTANAGFSNLLFQGKPVIADSHCTAASVYFLNENFLHFYVHPEENFRLEPYTKPTNQNAMVAKIFWQGAFGSSNNRMHGRMTAITA